MSKQADGTQIAKELHRQRAYVQIGVLVTVGRCGQWIGGKVALGGEAGAKGTNDRKARPVERLTSKGLLRALYPGDDGRDEDAAPQAICYELTELGREVYTAL